MSSVPSVSFPLRKRIGIAGLSIQKESPGRGMSVSRIYPFSCGTQYVDWEHLNCDRCPKGRETHDGGFCCDLMKALTLAYIGDGTIDPTTAGRIGVPSNPHVYLWDCKSKQEKTRAPRRRELS